MSITPIEGISLGKIESVVDGSASTSVQGRAFMDSLSAGLQGLNSDISSADAMARQMAAGDKVPVHDVMIALEQAHLKLQMAVEVRNRVVDAYQNLTNMQL